jgi:membrane-bound lytic murein transglycosylase B
MPSNILKLAVDGDENGKVDLFTHADAIFSVANYLQHHGWKPGLSPEEARKVLFAYNHSTYYVDVLMKLSQSLGMK